MIYRIQVVSLVMKMLSSSRHGVVEISGLIIAKLFLPAPLVTGFH